MRTIHDNRKYKYNKILIILNINKYCRPNTYKLDQSCANMSTLSTMLSVTLSPSPGCSPPSTACSSPLSAATSDMQMFSSMPVAALSLLTPVCSSPSSGSLSVTKPYAENVVVESGFVFLQRTKTLVKTFPSMNSVADVECVALNVVRGDGHGVQNSIGQ